MQYQSAYKRHTSMCAGCAINHSRHHLARCSVCCVPAAAGTHKLQKEYNKSTDLGSMGSHYRDFKVARVKITALVFGDHSPPRILEKNAKFWPVQ